MKYLWHALGLAAITSLAQTAQAQEGLECPSYTRQAGVAADALPDYMQTPLAKPGIFGGEVTCILTQNGEQNLQTDFNLKINPGFLTRIATRLNQIQGLMTMGYQASETESY